MDAQNRVAYRRRGLNYPGNLSGGNQIALGGSQRFAQLSQASKSSSPAALFFSLLPSSWKSAHHGEGIWNRRPSQGNIFGIVGTQGFFTGESATDISEVTPSISPVVEEIGDNLSRINQTTLRAGTTLNDCSISVLLREDACWWDGSSWFDNSPKPVYSEGTTRKFVHDTLAIHQDENTTDHKQDFLVEHQEVLAGKGPAVQFQQILQTLQVPSRREKHTTPLLLEAMSQSVRLDCGPGAMPFEAILAASTSGRVESEFWNGRRKGCSQSSSLPTGVLYLVDPDKDIFAFSELEHGRKLEEYTSIGENHSVSTCFEQGCLGMNKSIWMSTSHKLDANNILATHYANDLKGGADFTFNTSHVIVPASRLSTCNLQHTLSDPHHKPDGSGLHLLGSSFHTASLEDPTLEVELEQEKETKKVSNSLIANLRTGDRLLRLQSKKTLKHNMTLSNSYMTNLNGQHSVRLEAAVPIFGSGHISNSFTTDFRDSHEVCVKGQQRIGDQNTLGTSFTTNFDQSNHICVEAKHVAQGALEVALKVTNDMSGSTQLNVTTSHTRQRNQWGWNYRRASGEAQSLGVEWRHEVAQDKFISMRASTRDWTCNIYAELRIPF